mgnify:CR=1 FL=1
MHMEHQIGTQLNPLKIRIMYWNCCNGNLKRKLGDMDNTNYVNSAPNALEYGDITPLALCALWNWLILNINYFLLLALNCQISYTIQDVNNGLQFFPTNWTLKNLDWLSIHPYSWWETTLKNLNLFYSQKR